VPLIFFFLASGSLNFNSDSRSGQPFFNPAVIQAQPLGTPGNAPRRFFCEPGMENLDLALTKTVPLLESMALQFRIEAFNAFNHAQFFGPNTVNGVIPNTPPSSYSCNSALGGSTFGCVTSADAPRILQAALRFTF